MFFTDARIKHKHGKDLWVARVNMGVEVDIDNANARNKLYYGAYKDESFDDFHELNHKHGKIVGGDINIDDANGIIGNFMFNVKFDKQQVCVPGALLLGISIDLRYDEIWDTIITQDESDAPESGAVANDLIVNLDGPFSVYGSDSASFDGDISSSSSKVAVNRIMEMDAANIDINVSSDSVPAGYISSSSAPSIIDNVPAIHISDDSNDSSLFSASGASAINDDIHAGFYNEYGLNYNVSAP